MDTASVPLLDVSGRICVTPPYFALTDLRQTAPGTATATIPVETGTGRQATPIGLFEAARHLAVLGLSAASTVNPSPDRHYYLARSGVCRWLAPATPPGTPPATALRGHAEAVFSDPRHVTAHTRLTDLDGTDLATLTVAYDVLSEKLFAHFFGPPGHTGRQPGNPYGRPLPLKNLSIGENTVSADIDTTPDLCAGHFDGYPGLPVAITATAMTTLIDHWVAHTDPAARWRPRSFDLKATELPWAGKTVTVTVHTGSACHGAYALRCTAEIEGKTVTTTNMVIDLLSPTP